MRLLVVCGVNLSQTFPYLTPFWFSNAFSAIQFYIEPVYKTINVTSSVSGAAFKTIKFCFVH